MHLKTRLFYEFGPFYLDPAERQLLRQNQPIPLTPKAFDLLLALVKDHGRLLSKEQIMQTVWPDSFVEESNLTVCISTLRKALGEREGGLQYIETVPKSGYRFTAPVVETATQADALAQVEEEPRSRGPSSVPMMNIHAATDDKDVFGMRLRKPAAVATLIIAALVLISSVLYLRPPTHAHVPQVPRRLAILPFENMRPDPDSDFLGFSLADAVITKLGYVSGLNVRPSYSVQKYRTQISDIQKIAAELNVDTLLVGNFIRDGNDLRITYQLIDVKGEKILDRDTIDLRYDKLLTVQDAVAQQIVKGLALNLSPAEVEQLKPYQSIDPPAYEYYLRGVDHYSRNDFAMAVMLLEKSAELDPKYALTWAQLGRAYTASASFAFGGREQYRKAQASYERALALQPTQIEAHIYMANLLTDTGRVEQAVPLLREALRTNPNQAEVHWELGYAYRYAGMLEESLAECEHARQLDPTVKLNSSALNAYLYLKQYDKFMQSLPRNSDSAFILFYRGYGQYYQKNWEQAARDFDAAYELDPLLFQSQMAKAFRASIAHQETKGLKVLRETEDKIEARGVGDPEAIYKIAQAYAVLGDKVSALRVLRLSVENGFFPYPYFMADPLLDNLRSEVEFTQIMDEAQQRHESFKTRFFSNTNT